jgi:hypothetical protein
MASEGTVRRRIYEGFLNFYFAFQCFYFRFYSNTALRGNGQKMSDIWVDMQGGGTAGLIDSCILYWLAAFFH